MESCKKEMTVIEYYYWIPENSLKSLDSINLELTGKFVIQNNIRLYQVKAKRIFC